jgi:hypothetical protein
MRRRGRCGLKHRRGADSSEAGPVQDGNPDDDRHGKGRAAPISRHRAKRASNLAARQTLRVAREPATCAFEAAGTSPGRGPANRGKRSKIPQLRGRNHAVVASPGRVTNGAQGRVSVCGKVCPTVDLSYLLKITSAFSRGLLRATDTTDVASKAREVSLRHMKFASLAGRY